jgi:hypothetical protein
MDLLTNSVNVPAERAKLRVLRDEINANAQLRLAHQRQYTSRGFLRDMQPLATEGRPNHGEAPVRPMRPAAAVGVPATAADVREAQASCRGCGCCSCGMGEQGVKA